MTTSYNSLPEAYVEDYLNRHPKETVEFIKTFLDIHPDERLIIIKALSAGIIKPGQLKMHTHVEDLFCDYLADIKQDPIKLKEFILNHGFIDQYTYKKDLIASLRNNPDNLDSFMKEIYKNKHKEPQREKPPMILVLLIDESGSMTNYRNDTLRGIDKFIDEQAALEKENVTLIIDFFSTNRRNIYNGPLTNTIKDKLRVYRPEGGTKLYKSIMELSNEIKAMIEAMYANHHTSVTNQKFIKPAVLFSIFTDGDDNQSKLLTNQDVKKMIEESGWEFIYLKEETVNLEAKHIGVKNNDNYSYCQKNPNGATQGLTQISKNISSKRAQIYSNII